MASLNKALLIGRLGRDPELKYTAGGQAVCSLSVATDESYYPKDGGQKVEQTEWHRVTLWGKTAETAANYLAKGRLVYVEGRIKTRKWQDKDGQDRYTTEIHGDRVQFLDSKGGGDGQGQGQAGGKPRSAPRPAPRDSGRDSGGSDFGPDFPADAGGMDEVPF